MSFQFDLTSWIDEVVELENEELLRIAQLMFERVLEYTPVISGTLKAGWVLESLITQGFIEITIFNDVEYAKFVEEGTYKMAPRAMMARALADLEAQVL